MIDDKSDNPLRKVTAEHIFLIGLIAVSTYMFIESYSFREPSGLFPRFISSVMMIGAIILLTENYLPGTFQAFVEESGDIFDSYEEDIKEVNSEKDNKEIDNETVSASPDTEIAKDTENIRDITTNKRFVLSALVGLYVLLSYLIGFLWASPLFVLTYSLFVKHNWYIITGLTIGSYVIVYGFMQLLNVQLNTGILVG